MSMVITVPTIPLMMDIDPITTHSITYDNQGIIDKISQKFHLISSIYINLFISVLNSLTAESIS